MKKLTIAFALVLCLVLCVFAFASCKKNGKTGTTAEPTAPATTAKPVTTAEPVTVAPHVHTIPEEWDPVYLVAPTCRAEGTKVKYCEECGDIVDTAPVPIDPEAHKVDDWTVVEPTLANPVGSESGTCTECNTLIEHVLNFYEYAPYSSVRKNGKYADNNDFVMHKSVADIRGEKSFAPTEEDDDGNDLWFEYSFLYNPTLDNRDYDKALAEIRLFSFRDSNNWSTYRGFYYLYLRDNMDPFKTSGDCPFKGHIDYSTYYRTWDGWTEATAYQCAEDLSPRGNYLNGELIGQYKAGWAYCHNPDEKILRTDSPYLWDAEKQTLCGWHRLGFRYHQEVASVAGSTVTYTGYTELYIDGVLCWKIASNFDPASSESLLYNKNLLLWNATAEDGVITGYTHNDNVMVEMRLDSVARSSKEVLVVVDDVRWTCGDGFAVNVQRIENPVSTPITLVGDVAADGAMYFEVLDN